MAQVLDKAERRSCRDEALRGLNVLASELQIGTVAIRASPADVQEFFKRNHNTGNNMDDGDDDGDERPAKRLKGDREDRPAEDEDTIG